MHAMSNIPDFFGRGSMRRALGVWRRNRIAIVGETAGNHKRTAMGTAKSDQDIIETKKIKRQT